MALVADPRPDSAWPPPARLELDVSIERLSLKAPFRISGYVFTEADVLVVRVADGAHQGFGEASGVYYLDDTPQTARDQLEAIRSEIESGVTLEAVQALLPAGAARNALDCALWDLAARRAATPAWRLAGLSPPRALVTTFTVGADDPQTMAEAARAYDHARAIKLKLTGDPELDGARVRSVRAARPDVWLAVDGNQGFDARTLDEVMPHLIAAGVALLEQPLRRGAEGDLDGRARPIPMAADESLQGLSELDALVGRFDVVNIKLDKCGGLTEALQIAHAARGLGLQVMVGNMVGTSLAMAPAFLVGQLCDVVDLDGPLFLAADRQPSLTYADGTVFAGPAIWGGGV